MKHLTQLNLYAFREGPVATEASMEYIIRHTQQQVWWPILRAIRVGLRASIIYDISGLP